MVATLREYTAMNNKFTMWKLYYLKWNKEEISNGVALFFSLLLSVWHATSDYGVEMSANKHICTP
jgi:hypothetical protein